MRHMGWLMGLVLAGCGGEKSSGDECVALVDGDWTFEGTSVGMAMGAVVTMDAAACSFTFTGWDMVMGSVPDGGRLEADQVTLSGDAPWSTCHGTAGSDGDTAEGACDDGSTWSMALGGMTTL